MRNERDGNRKLRITRPGPVSLAVRLNGVRVYWRRLDGNAWPRDGDPVTRSVLSDPEQTRRFADRPVRPLVALLDPRVCVAVEVVSEPEACTAECAGRGREAIGWPALGAAIRTCGDAVRSEADLWVTAGTGPAFLSRLPSSGAGLTAVDLHVYHRTGGLPSREELARDVGDEAIVDEALPLLGGEVDIPKEGAPLGDSSLCNTSTTRTASATRPPSCGSWGAIWWTRPGRSARPRPSASTYGTRSSSGPVTRVSPYQSV